MAEEAQAVAEVAKTAGEIVRAAGGVGAYLARVFGSIPDNLLGLVAGDWLEHKRRRHLGVLEENPARLLERIAQSRLSEPSPSLLIPLLQAVVDEGRPELQALWAGLMANAMLDGSRRVRRDYFDAVRQMEPVDALVLDVIHRQPEGAEAAGTFIEAELAVANVTGNDAEISIGKLRRLECVGGAGG